MARKVAELLPEEGELVFETAIPHLPQEKKTSHERSLDEIIESLDDTDDNAAVELYRQREGQHNNLVFLDSFPPDKYTYDGLLKYLQSNHGTGQYRVRVRSRGKLHANRLVEIEAPKSSVPTLPDGNDNTVIMAMLSELRDMRQEIVQIQHGPQVDPMSQMQQMMQMMLMFKQVMGPTNQSTMGELLAGLKDLNELGLINIGGNSNEKETDSFASFLGTIAAPMAQIAQGVAMGQNQKNTLPQSQSMQTRDQARPDQITPSNAGVGVKQTGKVPMSPQMMMIKSAIIPLINAAKNNSDPELYCDLVMDQIPESMLHHLLGMLEKDNWFTELQAIHPGVAPYEIWFTSLRGEIMLALSEEPTDTEDNNPDEKPNDLPINGDS